MRKRFMNLHPLHRAVEKNLKRKRAAEEAEKDLLEH